MENFHLGKTNVIQPTRLGWQNLPQCSVVHCGSSLFDALEGVPFFKRSGCVKHIPFISKFLSILARFGVFAIGAMAMPAIMASQPKFLKNCPPGFPPVLADTMRIFVLYT